MKAGFCFERHGAALFIILAIIIIAEFVICNIIIAFLYIITDVNIIIFICASVIIFMLFLAVFGELIFFFKTIFIIQVIQFQCRIFLEFLLYPFLQVRRGYLQQLHQLYL